MATASNPMGGGGKAISKPRNPGHRSAPLAKPKVQKVSQAMIDKIKSDGMAKALEKVKSGKVTANYLEGVTRMYGARRVAAKKMQGADASKPAQFKNFIPKKKPASGGRGSAAK